MSSKHLHSSLLALCVAVLIAFVVCVEENEAQQDLALNNPKEDGLSSGNEVMHWPRPNRKFKCPTAWGAYPDPNNCAYFYICVAKFATRTRCPLMYQFCKVKRVCLPMLIAVCDDGSGDVTTEEEQPTTEKETQFVCPEEKGKFPYPHDCAKYYSCKDDQATLETCKDSQLFDGIKKRCRSAEKVHCGSRLRPTDATPFLEVTPDISSTDDDSTEVETETVDEEITTTSDDSTDVETETEEEEITTTSDEISTEPEEISTEPDETSTEPDEITTPQEEVTTPQEETTPKPRVTAPDTTCDANDLDCIISDLGLTPDWFACPDDLGSYPHPTSKKLFIFCLNWKPLVKKCGQDLVFSEDHMTCVSSLEFS